MSVFRRTGYDPSVEPWIPKPWMLPLIVVALVVPAFVGFAVGGTAAGVAVGMLSLTTLVVVAMRSQHEGPIAVAGDPSQAPVLAVALAPISEGTTSNRIATLAEADDPVGGGYSVLVLAPARTTRAQRWLSDEDPARVAAQERLAVSLASLAAAGCHAEGRVVAADPLQAVEDVAAQHGARRLVFVISAGADGRVAERVRARIDRPVHTVVV